MENSTNFQKLPFISNYKTKLITIAIAAFYIAILLSTQYLSHTYLEKLPQLDQIDPQIQKLASNIEVGMHVNGFPHFSFIESNFTLDAIMWFKFEKSTESLNTIKQFSIKNSTRAGSKLLYKSKPIIKVIGTHVLVCYHIQVNFMTPQQFHNFPLSDHRLTLILENKNFSSREVCFTSNSTNITFEKDILVDDWKPEKTHAHGGYTKSVLDPSDPAMSIDYPAVAFTIDFSSIGGRNLFTLYFPLFVVFLIGLISLVIGISHASRLGMVASSVPMLVLFRMVINQSSPNVGYPTHIDLTFYILVLFSLIMLFVQLFIVLEANKVNDYLDENIKNTTLRKLQKINDYTFFGILTLLVTFMTYLFFR